MIRWRSISGLLVCLLIHPALTAAEPAPSPEHLAFFEKKIRPVLAANCYQCHSAQAPQIKGGLLLDTRAGLRRGGDSGAVIVPGAPDQSLLVLALR